MKILHVFPPSLRTRFGGQNVTWKYNFNFWNEPGVEHYCLEVSDNQVLSAKIAFDFDYPCKQSSYTKLNRGIWTIRLINCLKRVAEDYDIIHFHILWWGTLLAVSWARGKNLPTIYESVLLDADTPGNIINERLGKTKVSLLKKSSCILAISDFLAQDYLNNGFSLDQVVTLMNSVDTQLFHPSPTLEEKLELRRKLELPFDATILIFVGSVIHRKGVDVLIDAFIQLSRRIPDLYLVLVGPHTIQENPSLDEKWITLLWKNLADANLTSNVVFLGLISKRQSLADFYRASDIFVFPSRKEGLGNVILEAMASGLPVIVSDLPVFKGLIQNSYNGITVPLEDASATAQAIQELIDDPILAERLGKKAREEAVEQFSFSSWQSRLICIYQGLITEKNSE